jgi:putative glycosyltransferase (TIGR04348 family)
MGSSKPVVCVVTPGTREANNGNWRTAARWARMLGDRYRVILQTHWDGSPCHGMIALHARRSADSIAAFRKARPQGGLAVVLTGTDLYRDLPDSAEAAASLDAADVIVTLQEDAQRLLPPAWRSKSRVIFQSSPLLPAHAKPRDRLDCVAVGHLREEKDPRTLFEAVRLLPPQAPVRVLHIGAALDAALGREAQRLAREDARYRYMGPAPRGLVRAAMHRCHVLVHPSRMEGGANVVAEAVTARTPVVASRISGNLGMLGAEYAGYFEAGDAAGLAGLLARLAGNRRLLQRLDRQCAARRRLFEPRGETRAVRALATEIAAASG